MAIAATSQGRLLQSEFPLQVRVQDVLAPPNARLTHGRGFVRPWGEALLGGSLPRGRHGGSMPNCCMKESMSK